MNIQVGTSSISGVQLGDTGQVDLQTLMATVMLQKTDLLDQQVRNQAAAIQQKNDTLKTLNNLLSEAGVKQSEASTIEQTDQLSATEANGKITIKISDEYTLEVPKPNTDQSWTLTDKEGNKVKIWGDPHVDENADGKTDWDFKQGSTFLLADGTKISVGTAPFGNGMTVTSSLTITRGDEAITVSGIDKNTVNYTDSNTGGRALDAKTNDGYIFKEGSGVNKWTTADSQGNQTTIGKGQNQAMGAAKTYELAVEANDVEMSQAMKDFLAANPQIPYTDSDGDGKLTASEYKTLMDNLTRERDSLTSSSQLEMTMLQSTMGKYNQTFEALSNFTSKYFQSMQTITGNLR